jgi:hypothetical protein
MNKEERDALREKHKTNGLWCAVCLHIVPDTEGYRGLSSLAIPHKYPCDVIQVLDWAESDFKAKLIEQDMEEAEWE